MKPLTLESLSGLTQHGFDTIIDVRAPLEFAEDHVPGAINLPVLSDEERARVGTIYKRQSPFDARKIGGALVAENTARHLKGPLAGKTGDWQPLVYCWRGGQRSGAFATILDQVGWRVRLLSGGYRSYRRLVAKTLYDAELPHRLMLIGGGTGTAKTRLLSFLQAEGAQTIDLEELAQHRGSLFGARPGGQPSQKMFESRLAAALDGLDPTRVTFIEAESSKIGERLVPPVLWTAMGNAPRIELQAPLQARAAFLCSAYADLMEDPAALAALIDRLRPFHAAEVIAEWQASAAAGDWPRLAEGLMSAHYDPRYTKHAARLTAGSTPVELPDLSDTRLESTARELAARFS